MKKISKIVTGFSFLDENWGGVYSGGNYLVFGPKKSGKSILTLNLIESLTQKGYNSLFITSEKEKNLEIQTASILFDITEPINSGILSYKIFDKEIADYNDLLSYISLKNPSFLFVDEIISKYLAGLRTEYIGFLEFLAKANITTFFVASVPRNEQLKSFVKQIVRNSTGIIYIKRNSLTRDCSGSLSIKPNIGHFEGEFQTHYKLVPEKGIETHSNEKINTSEENITEEDYSSSDNKSQFIYSNTYDYDEFKFFIENLKAFSSKSGKLLYLISYKLNGGHIKTGSVVGRISGLINEGDKLSYFENKIYITPESNDTDTIESLTKKIDAELTKIKSSESTAFNDFEKSVQIIKSNLILE